jgi:hypothetical protein
MHFSRLTAPILTILVCLSRVFDWVWTLQSPIPQDLRQSQIERNRLARGFCLAIAHVLHDDRADDMDLHLLKIDVFLLVAGKRGPRQRFLAVS